MSRRREFCIECFDDFRYDDCGGYNPPCECGLHCRSCHEAEEREMAAWGEDDEFDPRDDDDRWHMSESPGASPPPRAVEAPIQPTPNAEDHAP